MSLLVKEIYSPNKKHRVTVSKNSSDLYTLELHSYYEEQEVWEVVLSGISLYDSQISAEEGAKEIIRNESGEVIS